MAGVMRVIASEQTTAAMMLGSLDIDVSSQLAAIQKLRWSERRPPSAPIPLAGAATVGDDATKPRPAAITALIPTSSLLCLPR